MNSQWKKLFNARRKTNYLNVRKIIKKLNLKISFKIVHVIGTNGKGSISNYLAEGLIKNGYKVGLFTSPHLVVPAERIKVNNKPIKETKFFKLKEQVPNLNFFETLYIIALLYFKEMQVDIAILEAGIGGDKDTTKAIQGDVCVVTSIGLDHQDVLGNTHQQIAIEKSGIVSPKMHLYLPSTLKKDLLNIFIQKTKHHFVVPNSSENFLEENRLFATQILKREFNINYSKFAPLLGRVSTYKVGNKKYIFDVGHNLHAFNAVCECLKEQSIKVDNVVISMQKKKNANGVIDLFKKWNLFYFKLNKHFCDFENVEQVTFEDIKNLKGTTLLIGSFLFIGYLYKKWKNLN